MRWKRVRGRWAQSLDRSGSDSDARPKVRVDEIGQAVEHGVQRRRRGAEQRLQHAGVLEQAVQVHAQHVAGARSASPGRRGSTACAAGRPSPGCCDGAAVVDLVAAHGHAATARPRARASVAEARLACAAPSCPARTPSPAAASPGPARCRRCRAGRSAPRPASAGRRRCPAPRRRAPHARDRAGPGPARAARPGRRWCAWSRAARSSRRRPASAGLRAQRRRTPGRFLSGWNSSRLLMRG